MNATEQATSQENRPKRNNKVFWILVAVCVAPYLASWVYFKYQDQLPALSTSNHGDLISPIREVPSINFTNIKGENIDLPGLLTSKWTLLTVGASSCDQVCEKNMYYLRQIRLAMAKDRTKVQRIFVLNDTDKLNDFQQKLGEYEGMHVLTGDQPALAALEGLLKDPNNSAENGIYLFDPNGKYFMSYPPGIDGVMIIEDLRRVMEVSKI